jgi:hypothetical protein
VYCVNRAKAPLAAPPGRHAKDARDAFTDGASCSSVIVLLKLAASLCQFLGKPIDCAIALGQIDAEKLFLPVENPPSVKVSRKYHHEYYG